MKAEILQLQSDLQEKSYGYRVQTLEGADRVTYLSWNAYALEDEIHEAMNETSWKPWAKGTFVNREQCLKELIDAAHFWNNMWLAVSQLPADQAAELFETMYREKNRKNAIRQATGYDGVAGKCPHCHRALDDADVKSAVDSDGVELTYCQCGFVLTREEAHV